MGRAFEVEYRQLRNVECAMRIYCTRIPDSSSFEKPIEEIKYRESLKLLYLVRTIKCIIILKNSTIFI